MESTGRNFCKHIYLADDDIDDRTIFSDVLKDVDNTAVLIQAENGEQLLNLLYSSVSPLPHVVILDINMPKKNGLECLKEIRNLPRISQKLNVIIFSTCKEPISVEKAFKLGATCYAVKPSTYNGWRLFINDLLQKDWSSHKVTKANFTLTYDSSEQLQQSRK